MDVTSRSLRKFHPAKPARVGTEAPTVEVCRTVPTLVASDPRAGESGPGIARRHSDAHGLRCSVHQGGRRCTRSSFG